MDGQYEREVPMILNDQTSEMRVGYGKPRLKEVLTKIQNNESYLNVCGIAYMLNKSIVERGGES